MAEGEVLLAVNCGSSSVKLAVFDRQLVRLATATASRIRSGQEIDLVFEGFGEPDRKMLPADGDHAEAIAVLARRVVDRFGSKVAGIGHRVVHGGTGFTEPVVIDELNLPAIAALSSLAPAHQPHNVEGIQAFGAAFAGVHQIACFDTAFHRSIPRFRQIYAIPARFADEGVEAYGFHGLSCQHSVDNFQAVTGRPLPERLVICHLGNGASVTAVKAGISVSNSMGFTPLDGLVMGSRSGRIDPGAVLWLVERLGSAAAVRNLLNRESGLAGLSGGTSDMKSLLADPSEPARLAIAVFTDRLVREIASAAGALGGLDAIVMTGGIGERAATIRADVLEALSWIGVRLDADANFKHASTFSTADSTVSAHVIATDEERVIARATQQRLS